jgi:hypothetical protein
LEDPFRVGRLNDSSDSGEPDAFVAFQKIAVWDEKRGSRPLATFDAAINPDNGREAHLPGAYRILRLAFAVQAAQHRSMGCPESLGKQAKGSDVQRRSCKRTCSIAAIGIFEAPDL